MVLRSISIIGLGALIIGVFVAALFVADLVATNDSARSLVDRYGSLGILVMGFISGLNILIPIPPAAFAPIFAAAGYPLWHIVLLIVVGTTLADSLSYVIGMMGRTYAHTNWPKLIAFLKKVEAEHKHWLIPLVFLYAAFAPIPNEVILIPLALLGVRFRILIAPIIVGALLHHSVLVYGAQNIFELFF